MRSCIISPGVRYSVQDVCPMNQVCKGLSSHESNSVVEYPKVMSSVSDLTYKLNVCSPQKRGLKRGQCRIVGSYL